MLGDPTLKSKTLTDIEARITEEDGAYDLRYEEAQIVLPGDYKQIILYNNNEYRRWYRVVVANIEADEYVVADISGEAIEPEQLIPLEPSEELPLRVYFQHSPEKPIRVEIFVDECITDDPDGKFERQLHGRYFLVPAFDPKKFEVKAQPSRIAVRPWTRGVRLKLRLENRNALTVEGVVVRLAPRNVSRAYAEEIATVQIPDAIRPNQRLEMEITVPVTERFSSVMPIDVRVEYRVPRHTASEKPRDFASAAPRPLELVPIPYMRAYWPDWLIAGLIFLIINSILFGMPPVYKPELLVELEFEGYEEKNLPPDKIDVARSQVIVYRRDTSTGSRTHVLSNRLVMKRLEDTAQSRDGKLVYCATIFGNPNAPSRFANRSVWRPRGYLPYNDADIDVEIGLKLEGKQDFVSKYDVDSIKMREAETNYEIQLLSFSRKYFYGYNHRRVKLFVPYASRIRVQLPQWDPTVRAVKVRARSEDTGEEVPLEVECPNGNPITVDIPTHSLLGNRESCKVHIIAESEDKIYRTQKVATCKRGVSHLVALPPPAPQGRFWLSVNSDPPGAEVFADGQQVGVTPFENILVPVPNDRTVDILVRSQGYQEKRENVRVSPNQRVQRSYRLRPINGDPQEPITLQVNSTPQGAEVSVNGVSQGQTPFTGTISPLRNGTIVIQVRKDGYQGVRDVVRVSSGQTISRHYQLRRIPPSPNDFSIIVHTSEPDAQVVVNRSVVSRTLSPLPDNFYCTETFHVRQGARVSVKKPGYRAIPETHTVKGRGTLTFWLLPNSSAFVSQTAIHLDLDPRVVEQVNRSDLAVSVRYENNTIYINANQDCWVQAYYCDPTSRPPSLHAELSDGWEPAIPGIRPARNQRFRVADGSRQVASDAAGYKHLYLIATTANIPLGRDLLSELRNGAISRGKWCIVRCDP